jgi:hypothetical protein
MFEIGINVSKDVRSLGKRFPTLVRIEHQWFLSGNKLETFIHDMLNQLYQIALFRTFSECRDVGH